MKYYSTNKIAPLASLEEAVVKGLASDRGLYMPEYIESLDESVIANLKNQSFHEIACVCLLYTSPSPRDGATSRMPSSA